MKAMVRLLAIAFLVLATLFLFACGGGGSGGPNHISEDNTGGTTQPPADNTPPLPPGDILPQDMIGGEITLNDTTHAVAFDLTAEYIKGVISTDPVYPADVKYVGYGSNTVGWELNSTALGTIDDQGIALIERTANSDKGNWFMILVDDSVVWFNNDQKWNITGKDWSLVDGQVAYGNYAVPKIEILSPGVVKISFNSNRISGFLTTNIEPALIQKVQWNSNQAGWGELSTASAQLQLDEAGNYFVVVNVPVSDPGNFSLKLQDGSQVWLNIDAWSYGPGVKVTHALGQIEF